MTIAIILVCLAAAGLAALLWAEMRKTDRLLDAIAQLAVETGELKDKVELLEKFRDVSGAATDRLAQDQVRLKKDLEKLESRMDEEVAETLEARRRAEAAFADGIQGIMSFGGDIPKVQMPGGHEE